MAPVVLDPVIRYDQVARAPALVVAAGVLTVRVGLSLRRSYRGLGPAQDTRERTSQRSSQVTKFGILALVSLLCAAYAATQHAVLSYKVWASERDIAFPERLYGDRAVYSPTGNATTLYLLRWLTDVNLQQDAFEILTEKARRLWWAQQLDLGMLSWTTLLAVEGRRRNIPLLGHYLALAYIVSLAYAQNLFFVALLLTPSPLPRQETNTSSFLARLQHRIFPPKPIGWTPHPTVQVLSLVPSLAAIALGGTVADTPSLLGLTKASAIAACIPLALPDIVPASWGQVGSRPHEAYATYRKVFTIISIAALGLHTRATLYGLARNAPEARYHRHSKFLPFDIEKRSSWERVTSGFGKILDATGDHPVVQQAGWDVLLSTLSLGLWAAVRSADIGDVLACSVPWYAGEHGHSQKDSLISTPGDVGLIAGKDAGSGGVGSRKHRGNKTAEVRGEPDSVYEPTPSEIADAAEGDVLPGPDESGWESTALVWGMTALGGLGVGSAGLLGAECVGR